MHDAEELLEVLRNTATVIHAALDAYRGDLGAPGNRDGQYALDLTTDAAAVAALEAAGLGILSEESGRHHPDREICVVVDPVDGSTNASRGIPWYATSLAAVDAEGVVAAVVVNLATGTHYEAIRGRGARRDGQPMRVAAEVPVSDALVAVNGTPPRPLPWRQSRGFGAAALELCLVAEGAVDAYVDCASGNLAPWDYLGGLLVLAEAGGVMLDREGRGLLTLDHAARRCPVAASGAGLAAELVAAVGG